jgi:ribosomal RNA assembly protein
MEYSYGVKIPKSRIAVLIGKSGEVKKKIEESTKTRLVIDSKEGDIAVQGEDALGLLSAREIIRAIGRGFNPEIALLLLKPDYVINIINLGEYSKKLNVLNRIKGRVIGKDGKTRSLIEGHTDAHISVYGKTVTIIGEAQNVAVARRAVESLLTGSPHATVYKWLEKKRQQLYEMRFHNENSPEFMKEVKEDKEIEDTEKEDL